MPHTTVMYGSQEESVVRAGEDLPRGKDTEPCAVAEPPAREKPMERPHRKRQELRLLQLELRVVLEAIGQEREHDAGEDARAGLARQRRDEERNARA